MKVHQFFSVVKLIILSTVLTACCSFELPTSPDRDFYSDVRSHARVYTLATVRTEDDRKTLANLPLEESSTREQLYSMIKESGISADYSKLRIDRIYNKHKKDNPHLVIEEEILVYAIIFGIREVVGPGTYYETRD